MTVAFVIGLLATPASGATVPSDAGSFLPRQTRESTASPRVAPVTCSARKAVRFYQGRIAFWGNKMGRGQRSSEKLVATLGSCPRYLAAVLARKARTLRREYARWLEREYHPPMSAFDRAVAICETQLNFRHHAGSYEGAWGWFHGTWLLDRPKGAPLHAYDATPLQQWEAFKRGWYQLHHYWGCIVNGGYRYHL